MSVVNLAPKLKEMFDVLDRRVRKLETQIFQAPVVTADPLIPKQGMIWYRSDLHKFESYDNGAVRPLGEMKYYMNAYDTTNQAVASTASVLSLIHI